MKKIICSICLLLLVFTAIAQSQGDIDKMMKELQGVMKDLPPEAKHMMDSLGINEKLAKGTTSLKTKGITDKQVKDAVEDANRLVPKRNDALIKLANKRLKDETELKSFILTKSNIIQKGLGVSVMSDLEKVMAEMKKKPNSNDITYAGTALMFMMDNKSSFALAAFTKELQENPNPDYSDLNNFCALCNMMGGQEVSLPILNFMNKNFPDNPVILNNIGQAWYSCGDRDSSELFLKKSISIVEYNPEANETLCFIYEDKSMHKEAEDAMKISFLAEYSPQKEEKAKKLGIKITKDDYNLPPKLKNDPLGLLNIQKPDFQVDVMDYARHQSVFLPWRSAMKAEVAKLQNDYDELNIEITPDDHRKMMAEFREKTKNVTNSAEALQSAGLGSNYLIIASYLSNNPDEQPLVLLAKYHENQGKNMSEFDALKEAIYNEAYSKEHAYADLGDCINPMSDFLIKNINPAASSRLDKDIDAYVSYCTEALYYYMYLNDEKKFEALKLMLKKEFLEKVLDDANYQDNWGPGPNEKCEKKLPPGNVKLAKWEDTHCPVYANFADPTGTFSIYWDCHGSVSKIDSPVYKETETYKYDETNKLTTSGSYWFGAEIGRTLGGKEGEKLPVKVGLKGSIGYYMETEGGTLQDGVKQLLDLKGRPETNIITNEGVEVAAKGTAGLNLTPKTGNTENPKEINYKYFGQRGEIIDNITSNPIKIKESNGTSSSVLNPNPLKVADVTLGINGRLSVNSGPSTIKAKSNFFGIFKGETVLSK